VSGLEDYKDLNILVTGGSGQIGSCLRQIKNDCKSIFYFPSSIDLNLKEQDSIKNYIDNNKINFVINLAAYTNVDKAEMKKMNLI
jgi:dTDP-4-dehydrorhamnose reductase